MRGADLTSTGVPRISEGAEVPSSAQCGQRIQQDGERIQQDGERIQQDGERIQQVRVADPAGAGSGSSRCGQRIQQDGSSSAGKKKRYRNISAAGGTHA